MVTRRIYEALAKNIRETSAMAERERHAAEGRYQAVTGLDRLAPAEAVAHFGGMLAACQDLRRSMARTLAADNDRFDEDRWLMACDGAQGERIARALGVHASPEAASII